MGIKLYICGSQKIENESFVRFMLDALYSSFKLIEANYKIPFESIYVGNYPGADSIVREWAKEHKLKVNDFNLDQSSISHSLLSKNIPQMILNRDKRFQDGVEEFNKVGITHALVIPNENNELGVTTSNICKMLRMANVAIEDGADRIETYIQITQMHPHLVEKKAPKRLGR